MRMPARRAVVALVASTALTACTPAPLPLVPDGSATSSGQAPPTREVVIGVDRLSGGFNPHTLADLTPVSTALAGLLLPSPFHQTPDGEWVLDETLLDSAAVTGTDPFTVTYRIRHNAQWSDTTPIAAEDFGYLAEQMRSQPGVVGSAGYQLIDQVVSRDGGKTAEVVFRRPYPAWRTLFRHLLPAHLLKDAPGGWSDAFDDGIPVSGGPFTLVSVDPARGELVLARNDRYWDTPAEVDRIRLREDPEADLVAALRTGGVQAALFTEADAITETMIAEAGLAPAPVVIPQPIVASVLLRPAGEVLDDHRVRTAVAAALDRPALIATGVASGPAAAWRADSQVLAPSQPGYRPTAPAAGPLVAPNPATMSRLLTEAGYTHGPAGWERAGSPLRLVVAAPADREQYGVLAARVADQLRAAGIEVELRSPEPDELFGVALDSSEPPDGVAAAPDVPAGIDIVVLPRPVGAHPGTALASWYGCPLVVPASVEPAPPNPAGMCVVSLQPLIEQALTAEDPMTAAGPALEAALWEQIVTVPLYQQVSLLVSTPRLHGVAPGTPLEGPFDGARHWRFSG